MNKTFPAWLAASAVLAGTGTAAAGTEPYFTPLTESAPVTAPNSPQETDAPWVTPAGISQMNLTSMREIEADANQSVVRAPGTGRSASMWDMAAFDPTGRFVFNPHETPHTAGLSRYDRYEDTNTLLWKGDGLGAEGNWDNDYGAFDPATFTPNCTVFAAEEWSGEGRVIETLNPYAAADDVEIRELQSIANVAHEGLRFNAEGNVLYYVDEWRSGSIYKFVMYKKGDYTQGQTFVLSVDAYEGNPADYYSDESNVGQPRTGMASWVALTDDDGNALTEADPFKNGPTNDPRSNDDTRGGRVAADEIGATPYGRPEDMEVGTLKNGNEVVYFAATSESTVYSIEELGGGKAMVRVLVNAETPTNVGFAPTTGALNSPDNLAQDALGNIYVIEDAPNGSSTGGDIWFVRDTNNDGEGESLDHFLSIRADGSEATGMIFNPRNPTQFVVNVQHPDSTDLDNVPNGFGDALWQFDVAEIAGADNRRTVRKMRWAGLRQRMENRSMIRRCQKAMRKQSR